MKTVKIEKTPTTFLIPANELRAAFQCAGNERTRYYLNGVFVTTGAQLVGVDGSVMLVVDLPEAAFVGEDCATQDGGFILSCDHADKAFKAKTRSGDLWIYGDTTTGILQFVEYDARNGDDTHVRCGVLEFERVDGTFPQWESVRATQKTGDAPWLSFDPALFAKLVKASDVIEKGKPVRVIPGASVNDPMRVEFMASDAMTGTLVPVLSKVWEDRS